MYVKPEIEIIKLDAEDIIITSSGIGGGTNNPGQGGGVVTPDDPDGF